METFDTGQTFANFCSSSCSSFSRKECKQCLSCPATMYRDYRNYILYPAFVASLHTNTHTQYCQHPFTRFKYSSIRIWLMHFQPTFVRHSRTRYVACVPLKRAGCQLYCVSVHHWGQYTEGKQGQQWEFPHIRNNSRILSLCNEIYEYELFSTREILNYFTICSKILSMLRQFSVERLLKGSAEPTDKWPTHGVIKLFSCPSCQTEPIPGLTAHRGHHAC